MGQIVKELEDLRKGKVHKIYRCTDMKQKRVVLFVFHSMFLFLVFVKCSMT